MSPALPPCRLYHRASAPELRVLWPLPQTQVVSHLGGSMPRSLTPLLALVSRLTHCLLFPGPQAMNASIQILLMFACLGTLSIFHPVKSRLLWSPVSHTACEEDLFFQISALTVDIPLFYASLQLLLHQCSPGTHVINRQEKICKRMLFSLELESFFVQERTCFSKDPKPGLSLQ
jgi:hypothetical protein